MLPVPEHVLSMAKSHHHSWLADMADWRIYSQVGIPYLLSGMQIDQGIDFIYYKGDFSIGIYTKSEQGFLRFRSQIFFGNLRFVGDPSHRVTLVLTAPKMPHLRVATDCSAWLYGVEQDDVILCMHDTAKQFWAQGNVGWACLSNQSSGEMLCREFNVKNGVFGAWVKGELEASATESITINQGGLDRCRLFWDQTVPVTEAHVESVAVLQYCVSTVFSNPRLAVEMGQSFINKGS